MTLAVALSHGEASVALHVATMRTMAAVRGKRKPGHGLTTNTTADIPASLKLDAEGATAEMAAAKALGIYWTGAGAVVTDDMYAGDLAAGIEVRSTPGADNHLLVYPDDPPERRFYLVTGTAPRFVVVGWILGRDAKRSEWWRDRGNGRPCFWIPQHALDPASPLFTEGDVW